MKEETGIDTIFVSLLCFRHLHQYRWGTSDLYFVCLLKPLHTDIKMDTGEIANCKWMDVSNRTTILYYIKLVFLLFHRKLLEM